MNRLKTRKYLLLFALSVAVAIPAYTQKRLYVGNAADISDSFLQRVSAAVKAIAGGSAHIAQRLPGNKKLVLYVESFRIEGPVTRFFGEVNNTPNSNFYLQIKGSEASGFIIMRTQRKCYRYSSNRNGSVYLTEEDIDKVLCVGVPEIKPSTTAPVNNVGKVTNVPPSLQSLPGAQAVVYLDFDGQTVANTLWNYSFNKGNPILAAPANLSEAEMVQVWKLMSEDYRPFQLNVTTSEAVFNNAPVERRVRIIFTPTTYFYPNAGGVAYIGCFSWGGTSNGETPCWVFNPTGKYAGEAGSHESGHTLGLMHDGRTSPREEYFYGQNAWAPIMGVGYYTPVVQWSKGEYPFSNNKGDDLAEITTRNGFGYRPDDHGDNYKSATPLLTDSGGIVLPSANTGIISTQTDEDVFSFTTRGGAVALLVDPDPEYPNLDIYLALSNTSGKIISKVNPLAQQASLNLVLKRGTYYLSIDGTQGNYGADSDYGSLGKYSISGSIPRSAGLNVKVTSPFNGDTFVTGATIDIEATASSDDSIVMVQFFKNNIKLGEDRSAPFGFTLKEENPGIHSITAKVTDNAGHTAVSDSITISVITDQAPSVTLNSPLNNAAYTTNDAIVLNAIASDTDGTVQFVHFYNKGVLLHTDSTRPFTFSINNVVTGDYSFVAKAFDNSGVSASSSSVAVSVSAMANQSPVVDLSGPVNDAQFTIESTVTLAAEAYDPDGTISAVMFYNSDTLVDTDSTRPYTYAINNAAEGEYKFYAKAIDNKGLASSSPTVSVTVGTAQAGNTPFVKLTAPANNTAYLEDANITLSAITIDSIMGITCVRFYNNGVALGIDSTSPFNFTIDHAVAGTYSFVAKATNGKGFSNNSASASATVSPAPNRAPLVYITSPANNAVYYTPATIQLVAIASDTDGSIARVKFYKGSTLLKTDSLHPFSFAFNNIDTANYSFTAVATDDEGLEGSSASVYITVIENKAPAIMLSSSYNVQTVPPTVVLSAQVHDTDGTVHHVDFYNDSTLLSRDSTTPYSFTWTNLTAGKYTFTAKATDNHGKTTTSAESAVKFTPGAIFEAEDALLNGPVTAADSQGYSGTGYADYVHPNGDFIEWTFESSVSGPFIFKFYYANGTLNRPLELKVNGTIIKAGLNFSYTGGWSTWGVSMASAYLTAGINVVRLTAIGSNGPNLDYLEVIAKTPTLEAEDAILGGSLAVSGVPGYTGSGYVDYINPSGDFIDWDINTLKTGKYLLQFRYANGGSTNRPLQLEVNGVVVREGLDFLTTGDWGNWSLSSVRVDLTAGHNQVRLTSIGLNGPNIDNLVLGTNNGILQAEDAFLQGLAVASVAPGFTGTGYADYTNAEAFVEWSVNTASAGRFLLELRYANAGSTDHPLQLMVNGLSTGTLIDCPKTGTSGAWSVSSVFANLIAGTNKIRLIATGSNGPYVDYLSYSASDVTSNVQMHQLSKSLPIAAPARLSAYVTPNPATDLAKLIVSPSSKHPVNLRIVDISGRDRLVRFVPSGLNTYDFSINGLAAGLYIITVTQHKLTTTTRFMVVKHN